MPWMSEHYVRYSREVQSSDVGKPNLLVSFGPNRYESPDHTEQYDWSCTCEDWRYRKSKDGGYCKHIEHVQGLSPQQGGRSLWKATKIDKPLNIPDAKVLEEIMALATEHPNDEPEDLEGYKAFYARAQKALYDLSDSVKVYTPVTDQNGELIPAVYMPDTKPVFPKALAEAPIVVAPKRAVRTHHGGELNGTEYGAYLAYQDSRTQAMFDVCKSHGFDPNYYFTLMADPDENTPCSDCGAGMTRITSVDPLNDGYVCTNPSCSRCINSAANKSKIYKTTPDSVPIPLRPASRPPKPTKRSK